MNLLSKSILRITRKSDQKMSHVGTNAVLRIVFDLIIAYENSLGCRSGQVSVTWVASPPGQGLARRVPQPRHSVLGLDRARHDY